MLSPQIQLFNAIYKASLALGYTTIDYTPTPDSRTPYPFVVVGETNSDDVINNKDIITGQLRQTVHVWGYASNRAGFADVVFSLEQKMRQLTQLPNYRLRLLDLNSNQLFDNTTTDNLLHGTIEVEYKLY